MQHYVTRSKCWGLQSMEMTDFLLKNKLEQIVENFKVRQTKWQTKTKRFFLDNDTCTRQKQQLETRDLSDLLAFVASSPCMHI